MCIFVVLFIFVSVITSWSSKNVGEVFVVKLDLVGTWWEEGCVKSKVKHKTNFQQSQFYYYSENINHKNLNHSIII